MALSVSVVLIALSTLNSSILQSIGKLYTPIINAVIALILQTILTVVLLKFTALDVFAVAISYTFYAAIMAVLNQLAVRRAIGYKQEMIKTFVLPFVSSLIMCLCSYGIYRLILMKVTNERIALIPAIIVAVPVYFLLLIAFKCLDERTLKSLPGGTKTIKILKKVHLI